MLALCSLCWLMLSDALVRTQEVQPNEGSPWSLYQGRIERGSQMPGQFDPYRNKTWTPLPRLLPSVQEDRNMDQLGTFVLITLDLPTDSQASSSTARPLPRRIEGVRPLLGRLLLWINTGRFTVTEPTKDQAGSPDNDTRFTPFEFEDAECPSGPCSSQEFCKPFYDIFFEIVGLGNGDDPNWGRDYVDPFLDNLYQNYQKMTAGNPFFSCAIYLYPAGNFAYDIQGCDSDLSTLTDPSPWIASHVPRQLEIFKNGGVDWYHVRWPGLRPNETLIHALGRQMVGITNLQCDLQKPCSLQLDCRNVGSRSALGPGGKVLRSRWGYFALLSIVNLNQQMSNHYNALDSAAIRAILEAFNIGDFYPQPNPTLNLFNRLQNLATFFSIASGLIPDAGTPLGLGSTVISAISTFYSKRLATYDPTLGQRLFAPQVKAIYEALVGAVYEASYEIFNDRPIGEVDLISLIGDGTWTNTSILQPLPFIVEQCKNEILSQSLDGLWKTPTNNKMWVLYVNLTGAGHDCASDRSGPQVFKYCADDGVYYTYNFVEKGNYKGVVDFPWGGRKLKSQLGLEPAWVTEASAKTYRLAKQNNTLTPLSTEGINITTTWLDSMQSPSTNSIATESAYGISFNDLFAQGGHYPGSWTLPVCDAGTWGVGWNWDYETTDYWNLTEYATFDDLTIRQAVTHPPCMCGPHGSETADFVTKAGLSNFDTFYSRCKKALRSKEFVWPEGVSSVNLGFGDVIEKP